MKSIKVPTERMLELMIIEEEHIRQSVEYQNECTSAKDIPNGWLAVTEQMQQDLVKKFGFDDDISCDIACNMLRRAQYDYPNNKIFKEVPVYVRNNKANMGKFTEGDFVPNITIHKRCGSEIKLHDLLDDSMPTLILASSHT